MRRAVWRVKCKSCGAEMGRYGFRFCPACLRFREGTSIRVLADPGPFPEPLDAAKQPPQGSGGDGQTGLGEFQ